MTIRDAGSRRNRNHGRDTRSSRAACRRALYLAPLGRGRQPGPPVGPPGPRAAKPGPGPDRARRASLRPGAGPFPAGEGPDGRGSGSGSDRQIRPKPLAGRRFHGVSIPASAAERPAGATGTALATGAASGPSRRSSGCRKCKPGNHFRKGITRPAGHPRRAVARTRFELLGIDNLQARCLGALMEPCPALLDALRLRTRTGGR